MASFNERDWRRLLPSFSGKSKAREFLLMNQDDLARDCLLLGVALG